MVQFKHVLYDRKLTVSLFQFLYGAIQTGITKYTMKNFVAKFQFLYGAIQTALLFCLNSFISLFQFLYGAIQTQKNHKWYLNGKLVSIPLWCNSNLRSGRSVDSLYLRFNSSMVQFKP